MMTFEEFYQKFKDCEKKGIFIFNPAPTDFDIAVEWAYGRVLEREGELPADSDDKAKIELIPLFEKYGNISQNVYFMRWGRK